MNGVKLTVTMRRILEALAERDKRPMELKKELDLTDSTIHVSLRKLEEMGLVEKKVADKRYAEYGLTEKGKEVVKRYIKKVEERERIIQQPLIRSQPRYFGVVRGVTRSQQPQPMPSTVHEEVKKIEDLLPPDVLSFYKRFVEMLFEGMEERIRKNLEGEGVKIEKVRPVLIEFGCTVLKEYVLSFIRVIHQNLFSIVGEIEQPSIEDSIIIETFEELREMTEIKDILDERPELEGIILAFGKDLIERYKSAKYRST